MKLPEPVAYQYRWTNPADERNHPPESTAWKPVELKHCKTIPDEARMLAKWTYNDRPAYEVRRLFTEAQLRETLEKQQAVMRQALAHLINLQPKLANGLLSDRQIQFIDPYVDEAIKALQEALK